MRLTFTGGSVAWVSTTTPAPLLADIWLDGVLADTVNLRSSNPGPAHVVWSRSFDEPGRHVLVIRGKYGNSDASSRLVIDGFVVTR